MPPESSSIWHGDTRIALGRALLVTDPDGLTAGELAVATGKDQSNLRKIADDLVGE
jgi:hypothetical protein